MAPSSHISRWCITLSVVIMLLMLPETTTAGVYINPEYEAKFNNLEARLDRVTNVLTKLITVFADAHSDAEVGHDVRKRQAVTEESVLDEFLSRSYSLTMNDIITLLKGADGRDGADGVDGLPGSPGEPGSDGAPGIPGQHGAHGSDGDHGQPGPAGPPGEPGRDGTPGLPGQRGIPGSDGQSGQPGPIGPHGTPGQDGQNGLKGETGSVGEPGTAGQPGSDGGKGERGPAGQPGSKGETGDPGSTGSNGADGIHGQRGPPGATGPKGQKGEIGAEGRQGARGPSGPPGSNGSKGAQGPPGQPGNPAVAATCPTGWMKGPNKCYKFVNTETVSWSTARRRCNGMGGDLACPSTRDDINWIKEYRKLHQSLWNNMWIGGYHDDRNNRWLWTVGHQQISVTDWGRDEPNNSDQDCIALFHNNHDTVEKRLTWDDWNCPNHGNYICERTLQ